MQIVSNGPYLVFPSRFGILMPSFVTVNPLGLQAQFSNTSNFIVHLPAEHPKSTVYIASLIIPVSNLYVTVDTNIFS